MYISSKWNLIELFLMLKEKHDALLYEKTIHKINAFVKWLKL